MSSPPVETLRRRLTRAALLPALLVVGASGVLDYFGALDLAQQAQDRVLIKTAVALASRMTPDEEGESLADIMLHLQPEDEAMLKVDQGDEINYVVLDGDGRVLLGESRLVALVGKQPGASLEQPAYSDHVLDGKSVRLVDLTHAARGVVRRVLVTETNLKRDASTRHLLFSTLWPNLLLLLVMLWLMRRGIRQSLEPLQRLSREIDSREAGDLAPIPQDHVLGEIRPLVGATNRMLERLAHSTAEQQMFLSGAAHQLRTPLAGIQTQLELALQESAPDQQNRLARVLDATQHLAHCTQQMLALARSSAQASDAHDMHPVELPELLEEAASRWIDVALARSVELEFEVAPAQCLGSRWMLHELLGNLIDNAIQYGPVHGLVIVRCGVDAQGRPYLEVQDQGPGLTPEEQLRVFEPFWRGSSAQTSGSGLGLAIAREVANRHRAQIAFLVPPEGRGSCIRVSFPSQP